MNAAQDSEAVLIARLNDAIFQLAALWPLDDVRQAATAAIDNLQAEENA